MEKRSRDYAGIDRRQFVKIAGVVGLGAAGAFAYVGCTTPPSSGEAGGSLDFDLNNWDSILAAAKGKTVNYHQSGTNAIMNEWLNTVVKDAVGRYDIGWNYTPATGTLDVVNLVSSEMSAGRTENGSVDFMWVNGENFFSLKDNNYLYGPFLNSLPNLEYVDPDNINLKYDCGTPIDDMEAPFQATFSVFWANTDVIPRSDLPENPAEFLAFAKKYPGQFIYAEPGNSSGTYFVGTIIAGLCGSEIWSRINKEAIPKDELKRLIEPALEFLRELNPYLWNKGTSFPANGSIVVQLFGDGEINFCFASSMPQAYMDAGSVPAATRPFFFKSGVIHDFWYLAIPSNAANKAAALVAINAIMDPLIQISQFETVGYYPFSDYEFLNPEQQAAFDNIKWGPGVIKPQEMLPYYVPQANGQNNDLIEEIWFEEVLNK